MTDKLAESNFKTKVGEYHETLLYDGQIELIALTMDMGTELKTYYVEYILPTYSITHLTASSAIVGNR